MPRGLPTLILLILIVAALAVFAMTHAPAPAPATQTSALRQPGGGDVNKSLRILTANIRIASPDDKENAWPLRRDLVVKTFLRHNPDLIATQELSPAQGVYLNKELARWYSYFPRAGVGSSPDSQPGIRSQLLNTLGDSLASMTTTYYRNDRFTALDGESGLVLPDALQTNPTENAYYSLVVLEEKPTHQQLIVIDAHLRHIPALAARGAERLMERAGHFRARYPAAAVILTGDLNHDRTSPYHAVFTGHKTLPLTDAFDYPARKPSDLWGTYHAFKGAPLAPLPTDLLFFSQPLTVQSPSIILQDHAEGTPPRYPSDHFFILTDLKLP